MKTLCIRAKERPLSVPLFTDPLIKKKFASSIHTLIVWRGTSRCMGLGLGAHGSGVGSEKDPGAAANLSDTTPFFHSINPFTKQSFKSV
jgi:hypothetical protein